MLRKLFRTAALSATVFPLACSLAAAQSMPGMEHHHHDDGSVSTEHLGSVHFPVSCAAKSQAMMERGVALLHSFGYTEAQRQFEAMAKADPKCAMAHWGFAMAQWHELWGRPEADEVKIGAAEMAKAQALASTVTPREKAYIAALGGFFNGAGKDFKSAADGYAAAMKRLHTAYPEDTEGAAFYALAELASEAPEDTSLNKERTALTVLLPLFKANPEHPGLAHYIIHTCDTPKLAAQGLDAAKVYARIAPSSAHALHMPGHIFARLGFWQEDIDSNLASVESSRKAEAAGTPGAAHQMHADEFLIYAYLQVGEDEKARALTGQMEAVCARMDAMPGMDDMKGSGASRANQMNAIYALDMHNWKAAEALKPMAGSKEHARMLTAWASTVGAGRAGDAKAAEAGLAMVDAAMAEMRKGPQAYMLAGLTPYRDEMAGWTAYAEKKPDQALTLLRKAADQQDKLGQGEVDIPAREMLADLLLLLHRPAEALAEYKVALELSPNRLNGLLGAGAAAEASGNKAEAARYYAKAALNTHDATHSRRPELLHAVTFIHTLHASGNSIVTD